MDNKFSPATRMLTALQVEWPAALIDSLTPPETADLDHVKAALEGIDRNSLEDIAAFALKFFLMAINTPIHVPSVSSIPAEPFDARACARDLQFNLIDRIEREVKVARQNITSALAGSGDGHRTAGVIRAELEAANAEYHRVADAWLDADDPIGTPSDEEDAVEFYKKLGETLKPLTKKRLQLADELTAAEIAEELAMKMQTLRSAKARHAANKLHDKPDGSRKKQEAIRKAWASGHYSSRARCAEEECACLGMSYDAARKALRNTPDPP